MKIIVSGVLGRMGREVVNAVNLSNFEVFCGVDSQETQEVFPFPIVNKLQDIKGKADVLIDFSSPSALEDVIAYAKQTGTPAVLCATGYSDDQIKTIEESSKSVALLHSANMSIGVNALCALVKQAKALLGEDFDIEIVEKHHRMKMDSPSGTALMLLNSVKEPENEVLYGRYGKQSKRNSKEITVHAVRGGSVTGDHEVGFYGSGEQILLTHRAENRSLFAKGAVRAASFLQNKENGLYTMQDVLAESLNSLV